MRWYMFLKYQEKHPGFTDVWKKATKTNENKRPVEEPRQAVLFALANFTGESHIRALLQPMWARGGRHVRAYFVIAVPCPHRCADGIHLHKELSSVLDAGDFRMFEESFAQYGMSLEVAGSSAMALELPGEASTTTYTATFTTTLTGTSTRLQSTSATSTSSAAISTNSESSTVNATRITTQTKTTTVMVTTTVIVSTTDVASTTITTTWTKTEAVAGSTTLVSVTSTKTNTKTMSSSTSSESTPWGTQLATTTAGPRTSDPTNLTASTDFDSLRFDMEIELTDITAFDESKYVEAMAAALGTDPNQVSVTSIDFQTSFTIQSEDFQDSDDAATKVASGLGVPEESLQIENVRRLNARRLATSYRCVVMMADVPETVLLVEKLQTASIEHLSFQVSEAPRTVIKIEHLVLYEPGMPTPEAPTDAAIEEQISNALGTEVVAKMSNFQYQRMADTTGASQDVDMEVYLLLGVSVLGAFLIGACVMLIIRHRRRSANIHPPLDDGGDLNNVVPQIHVDTGNEDSRPRRRRSSTSSRSSNSGPLVRRVSGRSSDDLHVSTVSSTFLS